MISWADSPLLGSSSLHSAIHRPPIPSHLLADHFYFRALQKFSLSLFLICRIVHFHFSHRPQIPSHLNFFFVRFITSIFPINPACLQSRIFAVLWIDDFHSSQSCAFIPLSPFLVCLAWPKTCFLMFFPFLIHIFHSHFPWLHPIFPNAISWLRAPLTDLVGDSWNSFLSLTSHQFNPIFVFIFVPIARLLCPIFHLRSLHKVHFLSPPVQFSTPSLSTFSEPIIKVAHWSEWIFWSEWTHRIQLGL